MRKTFKYFFVFFVFTLFVPMGAKAQNIERLFYMSKLREKEGIESLKKNADKIDILAPQLFTINSKMKIIGGLGNELKSVIKEKNLKVMPLVTNEDFKQDIIHKLLISQKDQNAVIIGLAYLAKKNKYIGWQFDFENISYKDRDLYSAFVENTAKAFKKGGLILSVAAVVRNTDYEDTIFYKNWSGAFDYKRIANATDFISIMTYDDPNSKGPTAPISFVKESLAYLKDKIPPEKLSMGIPFYYWSWTISPLKRIRSDGTYARAKMLESYKYMSGFYEEIGVPFLVYFHKNTAYTVWYEDTRSFNLKLNIVKENNFRGFSAWVLGSEDPAIWQNL